ncbi:hypothetical protein BASA61_003713 [Batrachochytrium salamandrivorans]|nr:hypothetical protein BASA61_003713 [Batrachochytrium salamandrivorans]
MSTPIAVARIKRLDNVTVNRIAAGEIIHRPSNAIKELLENSLDAGATTIQVLLKDGGLKLLQIQDNGHGINKADMSIVCERFTTSKLSKYEDLNQIATYGFRGEALASISHIAHLTITTRTADSPCSWRAVYADGKLVPVKPGGSPDPKPCAGNIGTQITAEDLFHNVPIRRKSLNNASEEYTRVLEVVQRYAIHNNGVSFTCKKQNSQMPDFQTSSSASKLDNIRTIFGNSIARELLDLKVESVRWEFKASGFISNANFNTKRFHLLLFINHRLVESHNIKKSLEVLYSKYIPKRTHPFAYISLEIKPQNLDVNVHPTKRLVQFLHEDSIVEALCDAIDERLTGANDSRVYYMQTTLNTGVPLFSDDSQSQTSYGPKTNLGVAALSIMKSSDSSIPVTPLKSTGRAPEHKLVRTDNRIRTLDEYIGHSSSFSTGPSHTSQSEQQHDTESPHVESIIVSSSPKRPKLDSILLPEPLENGGLCIEVLGEDVRRDNLQPAIQDDILPASDDEAFDDLPVRKLLEHQKHKLSTVIQVPVVENLSHAGIKIAIRDGMPTTEIDTKLGESNKSESYELATKHGAINDDGDSLEDKSPIRKFVEVRLTSVLELREEIVKSEHKSITELFREHTFVGCVNDILALIQHHTKLYLVNYQEISRELFYQLVLRGFSNLGSIHLENALPIAQVALIALEYGDHWDETMLPKEDIAATISHTLCSHREMLHEYFSIGIDSAECLVSLPVLLRGGYVPNLDKLPEFILRLGGHVNWEDEKMCFKSISEEISLFYSVEAPWVEDGAVNTDSATFLTSGDCSGVSTESRITFPNVDTGLRCLNEAELSGRSTGESSATPQTSSSFLASTNTQLVAHRHMIEYLLFPAMKRYLIGTKSVLVDKLVSQVADLPDLYRVFERC